MSRSIMHTFCLSARRFQPRSLDYITKPYNPCLSHVKNATQGTRKGTGVIRRADREHCHSENRGSNIGRLAKSILNSIIFTLLEGYLLVYQSLAQCASRDRFTGVTILYARELTQLSSYEGTSSMFEYPLRIVVMNDRRNMRFTSAHDTTLLLQGSG